MTFAADVISFFENVDSPVVPNDIELLWPLKNEEVKIVIQSFYKKFYSDDKLRTVLFGINPGRYGAGVTGIGFTDPLRLSENCGIPNSLNRHQELSSIFMYEMINSWGGTDDFFSKFWFSAISPVGYMLNGKNINYYDRPDLQSATNDFIIDCLRQQMKLPIKRNIAFIVGQGKNLEFFRKLNNEHQFFDRIESLPHPRWVMQYKLKEKHHFIDQYIRQLAATL